MEVGAGASLGLRKSVDVCVKDVSFGGRGELLAGRKKGVAWSWLGCCAGMFAAFSYRLM